MRSLRMCAAWILCLAALLTWLTAAQEPVADRPPYELDTYHVAFLKRGPKALGMPKEETERIQEAHMAHIRRMADEGVLVGAGPFSDDGELRGIFIFKVASLEEAQHWTADDPAVKAGRLVMDLHGWIGPKGIGAPNKARMKADPSTSRRCAPTSSASSRGDRSSSPGTHRRCGSWCDAISAG